MWAGNDQQARVDFGYRAVHVVSVAAKAIQQAYYGQGPTTSYFQGCSDGGREGLMEAQRFPADFKGIVVGAPANYMWTAAIYLRNLVGANLDASGQPTLTADKVPGLAAAVTAACDANDGIVGNGLIGDPRDCTFDPASIQCRGADAPTCLTAAQVAVVRAFYGGARDRQGRLLDPRLLPRGSESSWLGWVVPVSTSTTPGADPTWVARAFGENASRFLDYPLGHGKVLGDVRLTVDELATVLRTAPTYDALSPDLHRFRQLGGKLIMYQGFADALVPPFGTLDYYSAVRDEAGGQAATDRFVKLFMVPGMNHCGGGPTPDTSDLVLDAVRWVEDGQAPTQLVVSDTYNGQARQRALFPYPAESHLRPGADPNVAASYVAAAPSRSRVDTVDWVGSSLVHRHGGRHH